MALHYLIWKGTNSRTKYIRVRNRMPIIQPQERVNHITIPGREGELTQVEGENIYEPYIQTAQVTVMGAAHVPEAEAWLSGDGDVTFDSQPGLKQAARIINAVTFEKFSRNLDLWQGDVQFYCQPIKYPVVQADIEVTSSGTALTNPGTLPAFPVMVITGSGAVSITISGKTLIIPECVSGWTVDCRNKWILNGSGVPQFNAWQGEFPQIPTGSSSISFTGSVTKIKITPNWRTK